MKRTITSIFTVLLALVMVLSLAACGSGSASDGGKDKTNSLDVSNAIVETPKHIYDDAKENLARVMQNTYLMNCRVERVSSDYFITDGFYIYLPVEELAKLDEFDKIAIIGKVSSEVNGGNVFVISDAEVYHGNVPEVAPRNDEIYSGIIELLGSGNAKVILNNGVEVMVYFAESEETSSLQRYSKIKFSSVEKRKNENGIGLYDAKLISVENN